MSRRTLLALAVALIPLAGCATDPGQRPPASSVAGTLAGPDGRPMKNVMVRFMPQFDAGAATGAKVGADGKFSVEIIPGEYIYYVEPADAATKVPEKFASPNAENKVTVAAGTPLDLKVSR